MIAKDLSVCLTKMQLNFWKVDGGTLACFPKFCLPEAIFSGVVILESHNFSELKV
jgi:hypothetical protein